jgi:hypothetical protein
LSWTRGYTTVDDTVGASVAYVGPGVGRAVGDAVGKEVYFSVIEKVTQGVL